MSLTTKHRTSIYRSLAPILGEEEADALLSELPATEHDELVTKQFLRAEMADLRTELKGDIAGLRTELKGDIAGLRTELKGDIAGLRTELKGDLGDLAERLTDRMRQQTMWMAGSMVTGMGVAAGVARAFS